MTTTALPATVIAADWRDFLALTKPRVMRSVIFTAICGMVAAPVHLPLALSIATIVAIAMAAGAAGALNQWYEADIDALMRRTANRPLPAGRMTRETALQFGVGLAGMSLIVMALAANWLATALLAGSIIFYIIVYTVGLKRYTSQNIVIGGAAGAFPPLIAWVAATGRIDALPLIMFAIIFLWTPPHSWALALRIREDYAAGGVPMLPVVRGARTTRLQMLGYAALMAVAAVCPWLLHLASAGYGFVALGLSAVFLTLDMWVVVDAAATTKAMRAERALFLYSIFYILAIFAALAVDRIMA